MTIGAFGLSGSTAMLGALCPKEVGLAADVLSWVVVGRELKLDENCGGARLERPLTVDDDSTTFDKEEMVLALDRTLAVEEGEMAAFEAEGGTVTGQKDHTWRSWSQ